MKRGLTVGEIAMVSPIFGSSVDYAAVRVHQRRWFPLQSRHAVMAPDGHIYYPPNSPRYADDFSVAAPELKHTFVHELVHVWQHQRGERVILRGAVLQALRLARLHDPYAYELGEGARLGDFNLEQQGDLIADYFVLRFHPETALARSLRAPLDRYEEIAREVWS